MARPLLWAGLALCMAVATQSASAAQDWTAPEVMEHGDWSTACDNSRECTSVSVSRTYAERIGQTDAGDYAAPRLWVKRRAGPNARPRVFVDTRVWDEAKPLGPLTLHVYYECDGDCTGRAYALRQIEPGRYELAASELAEFFAESRKSTRLATRDGNGAMHGIITTDGMVAALRYIDERQRRSGSVTAIYGKGQKPARSVPPEPTRPAVRIVRGLDEPSAEMPYHSEVLRIRARYCPGPEDVDPTNIQRFRLHGGQNLWSVICSVAPQNATHLWLVETSPERFEIVPLPRPEQGRPADIPILPHSHFDPASGQLTGHYKGDAVYLCGWKRRWAWTGADFAMIDAIEMPACLDIALNQWLQSYRAVPE